MKAVFVVTLIAAVFGGSYWLLRAYNIYIFGPDPANPRSISLVQGVTELWNGAKDKAAGFVAQKSNEPRKISQDVIGVAMKQGEVALKKREESVVDRIRNTADNFLTTAANDIRRFFGISPSASSGGSGSSSAPITVTENGESASSLLGVVVKRGVPLAFVISDSIFKNNNVSEISYSVAWGDGDTEQHTLYADTKNKFITHIFERTGQYASRFAFTASASKILYEITVVVE